MRTYFWLCFLGIFHLAYGQHQPLLYNVDDLPQALMLNPGSQVDLTGHIGLPFLSQIHVSAGTSGVSIYDIFRDDGSDINARIRDATHKMNSYDHFMINEQMEIITLGWKIDQKNYLSAGIYQELDLFSYFPKDLAILANEGNNDYMNQTFDFSQVAFTGEIMTVYHLGLNHIFNDKLSLGVRTKLYAGVANVESTGNTGLFTTYNNQQGTNYYRHVVENMNFRLNISGFERFQEETDISAKDVATHMLKGSMFGGNIGVGADFGLSYQLSERFVATASVLDLGMMFQRKDVENYLYYGSYETEEVEPLFPELDENDQAISYWNVFEEIEANLKDETLEEAYTTWRPAKFNTGIEYSFGRFYPPCDCLTETKVSYKNRLGMNLSGVKRPRGLIYSFTSYWDRKINETQRFRVAHTLDHFSMLSLGLMYSARINKFNFYIAANNLLAFPDLGEAHGASIQMGMQLLFKD